MTRKPPIEKPPSPTGGPAKGESLAAGLVATGIDPMRPLIERLARRERGRLVADILAKIGPARLELAEDVVQDAVIAAMATWPYKGLPDKPAAWLSTVARNKAYDRLRREGREQAFETEVGPETAAQRPDDPKARTGEARQSGTGPGEAATHATQSVNDDMYGQFIGTRITDPELKLIFLCSQPALKPEDQLLLMLKVVSGFTARDMAALLFKKEAAVGQRLARAKRTLRALPDSLTDSPSRFEVAARMEVVLKGIYLMFAVGYAPQTGDSIIRRDVAEEALRLISLLTENDVTATPQAHALAALLYFQASRFDSRVGEGGAPILMAAQDRTLWNRRYIDAGMRHLKASQGGKTLSRYHLEAGIAAAHASARTFETTDWSHIASLYARLEDMTGSPIVAVNACVAVAFDGAPEKAWLRLEALAREPALETYAPYHVARAEVLRMLARPDAAAAAYRQALACNTSIPTGEHIEAQLAACL